MSTDVHALAGPYALDALDDDEREAFERHLEACDICRAEVDGYRAAAARLGIAATEDPPASLRDRVMEEVDRTRQVAPLPAGPPERTGSLVARRFLAAAAAVLALAVAGLGALVASLDQRISELEGAESVLRVLSAPDARVAEAAGPAGATVRVVVAPSLAEGWLVASGMPPTSDDRTYQVWLLRGDTPESAGLVSPDTGGAVEVALDGDLATVDAVAITVEPSGGSPTPTTDPVAVAEL